MDHKGESRGEYLFITLLGLALISLANAQSVSCPVISVNDLGDTTAFSTEGLIALAIVPPGEASGTRVPVRINDFTIVCDASGDRRNTSSFVSVVVELRCMSSIAGLTDDCDGNTDITRQYQFQCIEDNGGQAVWGAIVSGSALFVETENPIATLSTPLANQCRRCIDDEQQPGRPEINDATHCDPCPSRCNEGQGRCYIGPAQDMCCNFYLQGSCTTNCPSDLVADSDFNCVCPELSLVNGNVSYSHESSSVLRDTGSVATHTCISGYRLLPQDGGNTRTCSMSGWSGQGFMCEQIVCPVLSIPSGTVGISPPGRVFMSRTIYTCNEGYVLKGDGNRVCQIDGTWNGTDPECADCSAAFTDPNCQECGFDSSGLPVCALCRSGYTLVDGQCAKQVCPALTLTNGTVSYSMEGGVNQTVGSVATHTCNSGYRLLPQDGGNTRTCNTSGWSDQDFSCEQIICPALSIMNGVVGSSPPGWVFNSTSAYTCDEGYALKGDGNRVCWIDSTWSGTDPECARADCSAALTDPNCQECGFDSSGLPICAVCRSGYAPSVDGQCAKQVVGSGVSSHSLGGILLTITIMALCAILE